MYCFKRMPWGIIFYLAFYFVIFFILPFFILPFFFCHFYPAIFLVHPSFTIVRSTHASHPIGGGLVFHVKLVIVAEFFALEDLPEKWKKRLIIMCFSKNNGLKHSVSLTGNSDHRISPKIVKIVKKVSFHIIAKLFRTN